MGLPHDLYRAEQVRALDAAAIETYGIPGRVLMGRAGAAAFSILRRRWPAARTLGVLCGGGNNGGDGYVVARLAHDAGLDVRVYRLAPEQHLRGDALSEAETASQAGVEIVDYAGQDLGACELLVDGMLGTGLSGEVRGPYRDVIDTVNSLQVPVLALDIPSGLDADTGRVLGWAVRAEATVTFVALKQGLFTGEAPAYCGAIAFDDLGIPAEPYSDHAPSAQRWDAKSLAGILLRRSRTAHKGHFGHVLVTGGDKGMAGAVRMASEAAARTGAGLVSVATRAEHSGLISLARPELMSHPVERAEALGPLLQRATLLAVGPGMGRGEWGRAMFARLLESRLPMVVDADGLNLLSEEPVRRDHWILTPHPGEAGRLLGCSAAEIQADRFHAAAAIQASFGGVCVLKGAGTVVAGPDGSVSICNAGNPGMASGGMGDVLTGVIAALAAQGLDLLQAARTGVCLHAAAADAASADGERGMLALDLMPQLRRLANPGSQS